MKTPEELEQERKQLQEARERRRKEDEAAKLAINDPNPNVQAVLRYVLRTSGVMSNPVAIGPDGELKRSSLEYNVGRQSIYHDMRRLMSAETKNAVERSE